jgi:putative FmdB family regulatory protein
MPLYEYKCLSCGKHFDALQKFSDEPIQIHEECGGPVERLISPPAFHFKGSGWYVTDYAKSNGHSGPSSDGKSESKSESKDGKDGKSDSGNGSKKSDTAKTESSTPAPASASSESK